MGDERWVVSRGKMGRWGVGCGGGEVYWRRGCVWERERRSELGQSRWQMGLELEMESETWLVWELGFGVEVGVEAGVGVGWGGVGVGWEWDWDARQLRGRGWGSGRAGSREVGGERVQGGEPKGRGGTNSSLSRVKLDLERWVGRGCREESQGSVAGVYWIG
jgi:hypothetical protein